jgi:rhomboid protease GluP
MMFLIMAVNGVHLMEPLSRDLLLWGANQSAYTLGGEWWRLITSMFIHIGIIHLVLNMYALYMVGVFLEPMLGKTRIIIAYLCTGVFASLLSIWWHNDPIVSAGASGAIFGLYGVFIALLSTSLIPKKLRKGLMQSMAVFVMYNLIYGGLNAGIDNAAHVGGLLSGLATGYLYYLSFKKPSFKPIVAAILVLLITVVAAGFYLTQNADSTLAQTKATEAYYINLEKLSSLEDQALAPFSNYVSDEDLKEKLKTESLPKLEAMQDIINSTDEGELESKAGKHRAKLKEYVELRILEAETIIKEGDNSEKVKSIREEINKRIKQIKTIIES